MQDMPGFEEITQEMLDSLPVEQRLAGLAPEQRLAGLAPEQQILALSDEILHRLPKEYLSSLPPDIQESIRRRIGPESTP